MNDTNQQTPLPTLQPGDSHMESLIEAAIQGHASTREAMRWLVRQIVPQPAHATQAESGPCKSFTELRERHREGVDAELAAIAAEAKTDEPVAYMWQHDETGRTGFVEADQLAMGWRDANPRLTIVAPCYTHPAPGVPDGYVLVPVEPTDEMLDAAFKFESQGSGIQGGDLVDVWKAMLAAAQAQKGQP